MPHNLFNIPLAAVEPENTQKHGEVISENFITVINTEDDSELINIDPSVLYAVYKDYDGSESKDIIFQYNADDFYTTVTTKESIESIIDRIKEARKLAYATAPDTH